MGARPVLRVPGSGVVKAFGGAEADDADRQATMATTLADAGVPVVRPLGHTVSAGAWTLLPLQDLPAALVVDDAGAWRGFGAALAALHGFAGAMKESVAPWRPLSVLDTWLAHAPDSGLADDLRERAAALAAALPGGDELLHTDPHAGNVRLDADGRVVLIDLDGLARGDGRYDLGVVEATERRHHGRRHTLEWLLQGYATRSARVGASDPALRAAAALREVLSIGWLVGRAGVDESALPLARARLGDLAAGRDRLWAGL